MTPKIVTPIQVLIWRTNPGSGHVAVYLGDDADFGRELGAISDMPLNNINFWSNLSATTPVPSNPYISFYPGNTFRTLKDDMAPYNPNEKTDNAPTPATAPAPVNNKPDADGNEKMTLGSMPDMIVQILTLSKPDMLAEFRRLQTSKPKWERYGSSIAPYPGTENCVSVVMKLLEKGGIQKAKPSNPYLARRAFGLAGFFAGATITALEIWTPSADKTRLKEMILYVSLGGIATGAVFATVSAAIAGVIDGIYEGYDSGRAAVYKISQPWLQRLSPGIGIITGALINGLASSIGIDNLTRRIMTTPLHVERLASDLQAYEQARYTYTPPTPATSQAPS